MAKITSNMTGVVKRNGVSRSTAMEIGHDFDTEEIVLSLWNGYDEIEIRINKKDLQEFAILVDLLE